MNCRVCGCSLPEGAMFCGECGSAVVPTTVAEAAVAGEESALTAGVTLEFSTGLVVAVAGPGLIGRRPVAAPGESFEYYVAVEDAGRSVSKTHLEFGFVGDDFWLCDRASANGTRIAEPGAAVHRCEPGKRYRVSAGTRVHVGRQFFDVC